MYHATVNDTKFEIIEDENGLMVGDQLVAWDIVRVSEGYYHILYQNKSYTAEVVSHDPATRSLTIKINGHVLAVGLKDKFDLLLEKMGLNATAGAKINNIKAPMPGLIIELKVRSGDLVKAGDQLLILEAMKMENIIKSPGEGVVKNVKVKKGESVEKGQILVEF